MIIGTWSIYGNPCDVVVLIFGVCLDDLISSWVWWCSYFLADKNSSSRQWTIFPGSWKTSCWRRTSGFFWGARFGNRNCPAKLPTMVNVVNGKEILPFNLDMRMNTSGWRWLGCIITETKRKVFTVGSITILRFGEPGSLGSVVKSCIS